MQTVAPLLGILVGLVVYGFILWVVWKFYIALSRIGDELSEIRTVLQQRLPPAEWPPNA
jgi:hypothetical protein